MRKPLEDSELQKRLRELKGWQINPNRRLYKSYKFKDFKAALEFVNKAGAEAEQFNHHPDIYLAWGKVEIELWTHDLGAVSIKDIELAAAIDRIV